MSERTKSEAESSIRSEILAWIENYLIQPHPNLGRKGPVCPWAKMSYEKRLFTVDSSDILSDRQQITVMLREKAREFQSMKERHSPEDHEYLTTLIALPEFSTEEDASLMNEVQSSLKIEFMNDGLMIGQFHPFSTIGGLHNPDFHPFHCPVHCFAIRPMIEFDHTFIDQNLPQSEIPAAVAAYLKRFESVVSIQVLQSRGLVD